MLHTHLQPKQNFRQTAPSGDVLFVKLKIFLLSTGCTGYTSCSKSRKRLCNITNSTISKWICSRQNQSSIWQIEKFIQERIIKLMLSYLRFSIFTGFVFILFCMSPFILTSLNIRFRASKISWLMELCRGVEAWNSGRARSFNPS